MAHLLLRFGDFFLSGSHVLRGSRREGGAAAEKRAGRHEGVEGGDSVRDHCQMIEALPWQQ